MVSVLPTSTACVVRRSILRKRQQRSRERRAANFEQMCHTKDALERAELVLRTIHDDDAIWSDFLDDDSMRVRRFLRQSIVLANNARELMSERAQLERLLREHQLASWTMESMAGEQPIDDWDSQVQHWRELTQRHFRTWTLKECADEMEAALKEAVAFQWRTDIQSSGLSFLGWREKRRVDPVHGLLQFQFYKTFQGYDITDHVNVGWDTYTNASVYNQVIIGPQTRVYYEVVQQPRPNIVFVRRAERYASIGVDIHSVYLVFRIKTERGYTQCVRSIYCPELMNATDGPRDKWSSYSAWMDWQHLDDTLERGYKMSIGGSHAIFDLNSAHEWMFRALGCVLRGEQLATGRKLITSD